MSKKDNKKEEDKVKLLKKGQNWSLDLVLGIVVFLLILGVFYLLISQNTQTDIKGMKDKGNSVIDHLDSSKSDSKLSFIEDNKINMSKLGDLYTNQRSNKYEELKRELGLTGDFCIVLEDSQGRVVVFEDIDGNRTYGFGNPSLNISGCPCGTECP